MMRDYPVHRANPDRERRPVLSRTATAARCFVLSRWRGDQSEIISFESRLSSRILMEVLKPGDNHLGDEQM